ncbi:mechanosensitive ion channel domain-containing protein [Roseicyclus sp.]|uniref:mechanosensitive ion channel domain-containing protein n=1 Tax=Roseicyclus sp. TaxID=1914329 RepID=UPI003F9F620F
MLKKISLPTALAVRVVLSLALCTALSLPLAAQEAPAADPPTAETTPPETTAAEARAALAEILRDEASREALIAELERAATEAEPVPEAAPLSVTRQIATVTQGAVQGLMEGAVAFWTALARAPDALDDFGAREAGILFDALRDLLLVIGSTVVAFLVLRALARIVYASMGRRARAGGALRRWLIVLASGLVDAGVVILAWAIGYGLAATVIGQFGEIAIRQSLYLNAFLAVEMVKVVVRLVVSPAAGELRPLPISDRGARRLYRPLNLAISLIGYGLLLVVPIVTANASAAAGSTVASIVVILAALTLGVAAVLRRRAVAEWLLAQGRTPEPAPAAAGDGDIVVEDIPGEGPRMARQPKREGVYAALARRWHILVLLWLGFILVVTLTRPVARVVDALEASGLLGLAIGAAVLASGMLSRAIGRRVRLPAHIAERLPRLEERLNGFVPQILTGLRIAILVALALFAVDVVGLFDVGGWLTTPAGLALIGTVVSVAAILVFAFAAWLALTSWVEYRLNPDFGAVPTAREQTLLTLLRNALTIVLLVITLMFALSEIGLDIGPLLASAGVLGLAIGFGAQKMVQDVITGVFIQLENAMNVGDVVTAGAVTGVVEKLTIRSVGLRDVQGVYHLVPFSSVDTVSNFTRDYSNYVVDMGVAYREDVDEAKQAMFDAYDALRADPEQAPNLLGDLEWFGLDQFADSAVVLRARIRTLPGKQWGVGRAYNAHLKRIFDARGIEIPFPHTTLVFGEDKTGRTQPLRVTQADLAEAGGQG